jgi:hypothetical protein
VEIVDGAAPTAPTAAPTSLRKEQPHDPLAPHLITPASGMSLSDESDILDVRLIRSPALVVLIAHPMPVPGLLRHLSTVATGELLQSHLTGGAKFVRANDRLPTDERAQARRDSDNA